MDIKICHKSPFCEETSIISLWPGCIIELEVKYSGNNLISKVDIDQEDCATLCLREAKCTHWTYNPTRRKCWLKTSSQVGLLNRWSV